MSLSLDQWSRLLELNPREEGESPSSWMARVEELARQKEEPPEPSRLPYREDSE